MVKLTAILNWNGFHNIPKKYIQRAMFKGVVYGILRVVAIRVISIKSLNFVWF